MPVARHKKNEGLQVRRTLGFQHRDVQHWFQKRGAHECLHGALELFIWHTEPSRASSFAVPKVDLLFCGNCTLKLQGMKQLIIVYQ